MCATQSTCSVGDPDLAGLPPKPDPADLPLRSVCYIQNASNPRLSRSLMAPAKLPGCFGAIFARQKPAVQQPASPCRADSLPDISYRKIPCCDFSFDSDQTTILSYDSPPKYSQLSSVFSTPDVLKTIEKTVDALSDPLRQLSLSIHGQLLILELELSLRLLSSPSRAWFPRKARSIPTTPSFPTDLLAGMHMTSSLHSWRNMASV